MRRVGDPAVKKTLKRILCAAAGLIVTAFLAVALATMWMVGQLPH